MTGTRYAVIVNSKIDSFFDTEEDATSRMSSVTRSLTDLLEKSNRTVSTSVENGVTYIRAQSKGYVYNGQIKLYYTVGISPIPAPPSVETRTVSTSPPPIPPLPESPVASPKGDEGDDIPDDKSVLEVLWSDFVDTFTL